MHGADLEAKIAEKKYTNKNSDAMKAEMQPEVTGSEQERCCDEERLSKLVL